MKISEYILSSSFFDLKLILEKLRQLESEPMRKPTLITHDALSHVLLHLWKFGKGGLASWVLLQ